MSVGGRSVVFNRQIAVSHRLVQVLLSACLMALWSAALPSIASAESFCTDAWTGPAEGLWQTPADWSTGVVPTSSDVACIGSGKTVDVREGEKDQVGVLQGEGAVDVTNGTLEIATALEPSTIKNLVLSGASSAVVGAGTLDVTGSFTWSGGILNGTGSLVILPGATASLASANSVYAVGSRWVIDNEGIMTFSQGQLWMNEESELKNAGTLKLNSEYGIVVGKGKPSVVNKGFLEKTEGAWASQIEPNFTNEGTVTIHSGSLKLWSENAYLESNSAIEGEVVFNDRLVTVNGFHARSADLVLQSGGFEVLSGNTLTVGSFALDGGAIGGAGSIVMSGSFTWRSSGVMVGSGSTVIPYGVVVSLENGVAAFGDHRVLVNEGTILLVKASQIWMNESAEFRNRGFFINTEGYGIRTESGNPKINNAGVFEQTGPKEEVVIEANMFDFGAIIEANPEGKGFLFIKPEKVVEASNRYGSSNPSALKTTETFCGDPINCVTGNYTETEKDLMVAGRGPGLNLTRWYNAEAAATSTSHGMFGYGWSSTYSDHLIIESGAHRVVLVQANGSTVPFSETEAKLSKLQPGHKMC